MANIIKVKRSAVPASAPTTANLALGELAINTYDGKLFLRKDNGTASIIEVGAGGGVGSIAYTEYDFVATAAQTTFAVGVAMPLADVYLNGVRQLPITDYTVSGTNIILTTGAPVGAIVSVLVFANSAVAGTVSSVSVANANGVSGTVTNPTTTPELTLSISTSGAGSIYATNNTPTITDAILLNPTLGTPASGLMTNVTGTAAGLTAGHVTTNANLTGGVTSVGNAATVVTNANLTGVITSSGNTTSIASQTGTGTKFVVDTSPTLITPALGTPTALVATNASGTAAGLTAGAATVLATARTIAGVSFNGSANIAIPLANLSDVVLATPTANQILGYNGAAWVNVAGASAGAGTGVVFYNATPVITATGTQNNVSIATLATVPVVTAEQTVTGSASNATGAVLFSAFVTSALGRTIIDAGVWNFVIWAGLDSHNLLNTVTRQVYTAIPFVTGTVTMTGTGTTRTATASAGTPFATTVIDASAVTTTASYLQTPSGLYQIVARTSDTVVTINNVPTTYTNETAVAGTVWKKLFGVTTGEITSITPDYGLYEVSTTAGSYAITTATKIGTLGFFTCTSATAHTVTLPYNGTTHNTHTNTPLANLHNELAGLNGGAATEYYHSTAAEYTGTGTGVFVRATNPILVTPALGTPSSGTVTNLTGTASININGTVGATTANAGAFTTLTTNGNVTHSTNATGVTTFTATAAPTVDMVNITNASFPNVTAGVSCIQFDYVGGAAAIEGAATRTNITCGATSGGIWNGHRIVPGSAGTGVTLNGVKFDTKSTGLGTSNALWCGTGWDSILNYNGTALINGTGAAAFPSLSLTTALPATSGGTGTNTYATGDLLYASAPNVLSKLTAGTLNYVLTSGGAGVAPSWAVGGGGGGGSPGGSTGQMQYNNAGAFAGAVNVTVNNNDLTLLENSSPVTPPASTCKLFSRNLANRQFLSFVDSSGQDTSVQPLLGRNKVAWFSPIMNSTSITATGIALTGTGTATAGTWANTNIVTSTSRVNFRATTATSSVCGVRSATLQYWRGNAAGLGGFTYICRFSIGQATTTPTTTTLRCFVGLRNVITAPTDLPPSGFINCIGVGWESNSTALQIYCAGTVMNQQPTTVPLDRTVEGALYEVAIFCPPFGNVISVTVSNVGTGASYDGSFNATATPTFVPANTLGLCPNSFMSAGGTNTTMGFNIHSLYIETAK